MFLQFHGFDWDRGNRAKCQKHGLSIALIESLFTRPLAIIPGMADSQEERRFCAVGKLAMAGEYSWCSRCGVRAISTGAISN